MSLRIPVTSRFSDYDVLVGDGLLQEVGDRLRALGLGGKLGLVVDTRVHELWGEPLVASLSRAGFSVTILPVPPGEASKSLSTAEALYSKLSHHRFSRQDTLLAFGGGVVGDLTGFVAATWHRGTAWVNLPTTLLAMVDASVGGKVGLNLPEGKNLIGTFFPPRAVLGDVSVLKTLPARRLWEGHAEMMKAALVADVSFFGKLDSTTDFSDAALLAHSIRIKADLVSQDEVETGPRALLNFGHTLGHALEAAAGYAGLSHGEAVVWGMRAATNLSMRAGRLAPAAAARVQASLERFPSPPGPLSLEITDVLARLEMDKKNRDGVTRWILLEEIGKGVFGQTVPDEWVREEVAACLRRLAA